MKRKDLPLTSKIFKALMHTFVAVALEFSNLIIIVW